MKIEEDRHATKVVKVTGPLIDKTAKGIFISHRTKLLAEHITYIILAVWGPGIDGKLNDDQLRINRQVDLLTKQIFESLEFENLNIDQEFVIDFTVRRLII